MNKISKLRDIKSGYLVELSNGKLLMKMRYGDFKPTLIGEHGESFPYDENETLESMHIERIYGLSKDVSVFDFNTNSRELLYERKHKKETNDDEKVSELKIIYYEDSMMIEGKASAYKLLNLISILANVLRENEVSELAIIEAIASGIAEEE